MRSDLMRRMGMSVGLGVLAASIAMAINNDGKIGFFAFVGAALLGISIPPIIEPDRIEPRASEPGGFEPSTIQPRAVQPRAVHPDVAGPASKETPDPDAT
jgi:hypothetical protein